MRQVNGKPAKWQWILSSAMVIAGLLLQLPFAPAILRERLSPILIPTGILCFLITFYRKEKFDDLPLEEQKELDRMNRDERNQMIYEKAAWRCWQWETVLLFVILILFCLIGDRIGFVDALDYRVVSLVMLLYWGRILVFGLVQWQMNRKY